MAELLDEQVAEVRAFTRRWSEVTKLLDSDMYDTPYSLTEGRVIYELGQRDIMELLALRTKLGLDPSYLTRMVRRFRADGLVDAEPSPEDGRKQLLRLTEHGRALFKLLDERAQEQNRALLTPLTEPDRQRLVHAMGTIRALVDPAEPEPTFRLRGLRPGELGWVVARHGAVYAQEYDWDSTFEALVASIVGNYVTNFVPGKDNGWLAEVNGAPVGGIFCVHSEDPDVAQLRLLLVEPTARGMGIGAKLVAECVGFARQAGYRRMVLFTTSILVAARRIYQAAGFRLRDEQPEHLFGHDLVTQNWELDLTV